jgi:prepilin-type N-terminal cleavage/methylation domain-containing protein
MRLGRKRGFSVVELLIVLAIVVGFAGIVVPIISHEALTAKQNEAMDDLNRIASAVNLYIRDTLLYPTGINGATTYHYLYSEGEVPINNPMASGPGMSLDEFLNSGDYGGSDWQGPYLANISCDPWGNAYLVNTQGYFNSTERIFVISAGENGVIDTPLAATTACGDDLLIVLD